MGRDLTQDEIQSKTVQAVDSLDGQGDGLIRLSTGVVLRAKAANPMALIVVMSNFPAPPVPTYYNKDMGRMMENPDDPDYQARRKSVDMERTAATLNAMILLGTELHSVPDGFGSPSDDEWLEEYALLGLSMTPSNKRWRYLKWVFFRAAPHESDLEKIQNEVGKLSGVRKEAVEAAETFPGSAEKSR